MSLNKKTSFGSLSKAFTNRNIPVLIINPKLPYIFQAGLGCQQKRFRGSEFNNSPGYIFTGYKKKTNQFLFDNNLPVAKSFFVKTPDNLEKIINKIGFPCVIKPANTSSGGKGVTVNVKNLAKAKQAFAEAMSCLPGIKGVMVEEMITGADHRILVFKNRVIGALKRTPAHIKADGKNSIADIVDAENKKRAEKKGAYLKPIKTDDLSLKVLESQGYNLSDIPPAGKTIWLRSNANISTGGETTNVTALVNKDTAAICCLVTRILGMEIAGIDIITTDINKPLSETGGKIIEVNNHPGLDGHIKPVHGDPINVAKIISENFFPNPIRSWIPIISQKEKIAKIELLNKSLNLSPKKVYQYKKVITKPCYNLRTYLLDPLTTAIEL